MRKLLWLIVICLALFCGWWVVLSFSLSSGIQAWLADRRAEGWQAEVTDISRRGFPLTLRTILEAPALADPDTGVALSLPRLTLAARTIWPGDMQVILPDGPIELASPDGAVQLFADTAVSDLNLHPGTSLELENLSLTSGPLRLENPIGGLFAADGLELRMAQTDVANTYDFTVRVGQFAPGEVPRNALLIPDSWPVIFDALGAKARITFDRPWDRRTLEERRPQPTRIVLSGAEAHWGEIRLRVATTLDVDQRGIPTGDVTIKAENWEAALQFAQNAGLLSPDMRETAARTLSSIASGTGRTNEMDLTITFEGGVARVGFLSLGPAPRLILR